MSSEATRSHTTEIERIAEQMERSFEGDAWHGSSISEILACISADQAAVQG